MLAIAGALAIAVTATAASSASVAAPQAPQAELRSAAMPQYDREGALLLPQDYRGWVLVGSSLGLSYGDAAPDEPMFHHTLMEPSAYEHYVRTGRFREGTMLALLLHRTGSNVLRGRHGRFAGELLGVELAVKDTARRPEGWAYYDFSGRTGARPTAQPQARTACYECHRQHAADDNVFTQFYSLLEAAPARASLR